MKQIFKVGGMSCSACSASVERVVGRIPGVSRADVNLLSGILICEYDPAKAKEQQIIAAIEKAGFSAAAESRSLSGAQKKERITVANTAQTTPSERTRLIVSLCFLLPLMYISMGRMISLPVPRVISREHFPILFTLTQAILAAPVLIINSKFFTNGFKSLIKGHPNMDALVATGSGAAYLFGIFSLYMIAYASTVGDEAIISRYADNLYFESAAMILTLITVGKTIEARSKKKTGAAVEGLKKLSPRTANVIRDEQIVSVDISEVAVGDQVMVKAGENIPVDGIIEDGGAYIDQSALTGESIPVYKKTGEKVFAATTLTDGLLRVRATAVGDETSLMKVIDLVSEAGATKAPIATMADKVAGIFVPSVMGIALVTLIIWLILKKPFEFALSNAVSVLVISCPCALGLATPVAITVAVGAGAKRGILIKSAEVFERIRDAKYAVFDKTGTLTESKPVVLNIASDNIDELKGVALSLEKLSSHPLSIAVTEAFEGARTYDVSDFETVGGLGVSGMIDGEKCLGGNEKFMLSEKLDLSEYSERARQDTESGKTLMWFSKGDTVLGYVAVADKVRSDAAECIAALHRSGVRVMMLTGDNESVGQAVAKELKLDGAYCSLMPEDKEKILATLSESGRTVFIGDGINDSPAMARADVGIAMSGGTQIAIDSADIVLMHNSVKDVATCFEMGKKTVGNIKMNLFWAFFYNVICIPIATGFLGITLSPMIAAAAMSVSSLFVVGNALRLRSMA